MLQPGAMAMKREDAMRLLRQVGAIEERLERLAAGCGHSSTRTASRPSGVTPLW
jgi:hypothetical protein